MAVTIKKGKKAALPSWAKRGTEANEALAQEEAKAEMRNKDMRKAWRFFLKVDEKAVITFLDGDVVDGALDYFQYWEHGVKHNGRWSNFVCIRDMEPCPICENDDPYLAGVFTVLDHRPYTAKDGTVYQHNRKLLVAKRGTLKTLHNMGVKRGGLVGAQFEVSRTGAKEANVGSMWDFEQKLTLKELKKKYETKDNPIQPLDYEVELPFHSSQDLRTLGFGSFSIGGEDADVTNVDAEKKVDDEI